MINHIEPPEFSCIIATLGRFEEINALLSSLEQQDIGKEKIEVIIIDQNKTDKLKKIVDGYSAGLRVHYFKSENIGLSLNRNIGLSIATGKYICFPDDDCTYYPETLKNARYEILRTGSDIVIGRIFDKYSRKNIIKNWPTKNLRVSRWNFFGLSSSITIFSKRNSIIFDERMGAGCEIGACEDLDYIYSAINNKFKIFYSPSISVWHPDPEISEINDIKIFRYGAGLGFFCAKNYTDIAILKLILSSLTYHFLLSIIGLLKLDLISSRKRFIAFKSRALYFIKNLSLRRQNTYKT